MDKKLTSNYIYSVIYQLLLVIAPLIITPYIARTLGITAQSINDATANNIQYFVLFGIMGVNIYGNREVARVRDDKKILSRTFFEIFAMQFCSMLLSTLVFFIYLYAYSPKYSDILLIQAITLLGVSLDITWFFYGVEDFKKASIRNMFVKIMNIVLIFLLIKKPSDLPLFVFLNAVGGVVGQLIMWAQLRQYIHFEKIDIQGVIKHVKPNIILFIPQIAISIYSLLDISMLGVLYSDINLNHIALYRNSQAFVKMFLFFITSIGSVMLPRISHGFVKGNIEAINNYLNKTFRIAMYLAIPMMVGIIVVIQNFINWFLPPDYSEVGLMIKLASPIILFISISNVFGTQFMVPVGDYKNYTTSVISGAVVNCLVNFALIPSWGAYGAIAGSVVAEFTVTLVQYFYVRGKLKVRITNTELFKILVSAVFMGVFAYLTGHLLGASFISNITQIAVGMIAYVIALYFLKAELFTEILSSFKKGRVNNG